MNKYTLISVLVVVGALVASTYLVENTPSFNLITKDEAEVYTAFEEWIIQNAKNYREEEEKTFRFLKFKANFEFIREHNARYEAGKQTFDVGLNPFADMDNYEFSSKYHGKKQVKPTKKVGATSSCKTTLDIKTDLPASVDWANKAVGPVRNQGQCGSCWAFSATGALQGLDALKSGKGTVRTFAPQQLVDCAGGSYGNEGCNGGDMDAAFWYVTDNGIAEQKDYAYRGVDQKCKYTSAMKAFANTDCAEIKPNNTVALKSAVFAQPVSIAVEADSSAFQLYRSGVFSSTRCGIDLDHGITLTGYGVDSTSNKPYWRCRNSWGGSWGSSGYILIERDDSLDGKPGMCGILIDNTVPLL